MTLKDRDPLPEGEPYHVGRPPRRPRAWGWLVVPLVFLAALSVYLWDRPDLVRRQLAQYLPSPTPTPTATPGAREVQATAEAQLADGHVNEGLATYATVVASDPGFVEGYVAQARWLSLRRRHADALAAGRKAVELAPQSAVALAALAFAQDWADQSDAAIETAQRAVEADPKDALAHAVLAEAYAATGGWDLAQSSAERAIELAPDSPDAHRALGMAREMQGDAGGALKAYGQAAELAPKQARFQIDIGRIHRFVAETTAAREAFTRATELDPQDPTGYDSLGLLDYGGGDLDAAAAHFKQAITVEPGYGPGYGHLAWVDYARTNWAPAAANFQKAIDLGVQNVEFYYELGLSLAYQGRCPDARPWLLKALEHDPDAQPAKDGLKLCP